MPEKDQLIPQAAPPRQGGVTAFYRTQTFIYLAAAAAVLTPLFLFIRRSSPPARGATKTEAKTNLVYIWVPEGVYEQGCSKVDGACEADEKPAHEVTVSKGFWMGKTEVTVGSYFKFASSTNRRLPPESTFGSRNLNPGWANKQAPIVNVDWNDAHEFCEWSGGALPTESQWEYAARGDSSGPGETNLSAAAWYANNSGSAELEDAAALLQADGSGFLGRLAKNGNTFHNVGQLAPNSFGLCDMLGNVWEWTADWYGASYYQSNERGDPKGPADGQARVLRGGAWVNVAGAVRMSVRGRRPRDSRSVDTGFRCTLPQ
ncbi:MAG: formylglycine-generating enzyme family protein [Bryobacteraceae bacterium]